MWNYQSSSLREVGRVCESQLTMGQRRGKHMAAYDPSATPQQLWDLILSTNPYLKQGIIQAPTSMKLNLGEAIKDDWWEQATSEGKQATYGPRTLLVELHRGGSLDDTLLEIWI